MYSSLYLSIRKHIQFLVMQKNDISSNTEISRRTVARALHEMVENGEIERVGMDKKGTWKY